MSQGGIKKILFIHHSAGWGGAASCMVNLILNLDSSKYSAEVLLLKNSNIAEKLSEKGIAFTIAKSTFYRKYYHFFPHSEAGYIKWYQIFKFIIYGLSWILSRYIYSKRELENHEFSIVHLNSSVLTDWIVQSKRRAKVIIHIREPFRKGKVDFLHHIFKSIIKKHANKIICISNDNARRIGIPEKTTVIYDFFSIPEHAPPVESYSSKKVLYLGGSSTSKGFYTVVDSLDYLDKDIRIYFAGKYVESNKSRTLIGALKFIFSKAKLRNAAIMKIKNHPNAVFLDLIFNVEDFLQEVCCVISPFVVSHFSCPVAESHINRKPAIGSDVEGMDEIIQHGINGQIVPKNNPKALSDAINLITSDCEVALSEGEAGYKVALLKYSPDNIRQFENVYEKL